MSVQNYGVLAVWAAGIVLSVFFPWAHHPEDSLLFAILLGWMPGTFPGMLLTTPIGLAIGRRMADDLGLRENAARLPAECLLPQG
jgi:hypothetical protein